MNKKMRKFAIPMAVALLLQGTLPATSMASSEISARAISTVDTIAAPVQVKVTLEDAIKLVKNSFTIPTGYNEFTSGYNSYNERQTWSLNWKTTNELGGSFSAQVDVTTGEIVSMNCWQPVNPTSQNKVLKLSYDEAKTIAQNLVSKILGDRLDQLELVPEISQIMPVVDYGYTTYTVQWKRVVNGIPFPSNGVSIQVNAYDGTVSGYNLTWSKEGTPDINGVISIDKAREAFISNELLELQYYLNSGIRPLDSLIRDGKKNALLVYKLSNESFNGMIDAKTGLPIKLNPGEWLYNENIQEDGVGGYGGIAKSSEQALTPEEQSEVSDNAKLLSQEKAIESVKKWVEIPDGLILRSANLGFDGGITLKRTWTLDWSSEDSADGYNYVYARVDATTGEVIGFNAYSSSQAPKNPNAIDRLKAKAVADAFLKKIQPNRVEQVQYLEVLNNGQKYPEDQPNHDFRYQRMVNGVPVPGNGFSVAVDRNTQKIVSFDMDFSDVNFPGVSLAMSQKQGEDTFLNKRPLELKYVQIYKNGQLADIRLVYQPKMDNAFTVSNIMDAKTGEFLDWQGKPIAEQPRPYNFNDIAGNFAEDEIKLLGQAGAFGEYGEQFKPNENVSVKSLLKAMLVAKNGVWSYQGLTDEDILKQVKDLGWVKENVSLNEQVSREYQAKLVVRMLQLDKIAEIEDLFQVPYEDSDSFSTGSLGYIALVKGLGVVNTDSNKFEPTKQLTRAEAAYAIVKALQASR